MKKLLLSLALLLTISACIKPTENNLDNRIISNNKTETGQTVVNSEPIEGILKAQEVKLNMYGTHILEDEMGAFLVYLQSKKISLSAYTDAKVSIEGELITTFDGEKILEVNTLKVLSEGEEEVVVGDQTYISPKLDINLTIPAEWQQEESEDKLKIYANGDNQLLQITKIENRKDKNLEKFVDEKDGVDLTVNEYEAIRTIQGETINVYIKAGENVYKVVFTPVENSATEKSRFYAILKTFSLNEEKKETKTKVCGGAGKIKCDAGFRCEINSQKELATGICIKIEGENPEDGDIAVLNTNETESAEVEEVAQKNEKFQVIDYVNENIDALLAEKEIDSVEIEGYEFSENGIVSVILKTAEKKYKTQYKYVVVDEYEVDLSETAFFEEGEGRDWEKISGEDKQSDTEKEVVTSEGETQAVVYEDMRFYENTHQNYTLQYPRSWYYSSFGVTNNTIWHVGFSDEEVELGTEKISVDILSGKVNTLEETNSGGLFKISLPRDDDTYFEIYGDEAMKETIKKMAETIEQK